MHSSQKVNLCPIEKKHQLFTRVVSLIIYAASSASAFTQQLDQLPSSPAVLLRSSFLRTNSCRGRVRWEAGGEFVVVPFCRPLNTPLSVFSDAGPFPLPLNVCSVKQTEQRDAQSASGLAARCPGAFIGRSSHNPSFSRKVSLLRIKQVQRSHARYSRPRRSIPIVLSTVILLSMSKGQRSSKVDRLQVCNSDDEIRVSDCHRLDFPFWLLQHSRARIGFTDPRGSAPGYEELRAP